MMQEFPSAGRSDPVSENPPRHSVVGRWEGGWDEDGLRAFAENLRRQLGPNPVKLALVFTTPAFFPHAEALLELVRVHAQAPLLAGCSSHGIVAGEREDESGAGLVLGLYSLPGATLQAAMIPPGEVDISSRLRAEGFSGDDITGWLAFIEPFQTNSEAWIESWQAAFPGAPIYGGLAAGGQGDTHAQVYFDGRVIESGGVVLGFRGVRVLGAVAQGCTPVGDTWTITRVEGNVVHRIGNRPAFDVLEETFEDLKESVKERSRGNFFAGLVVDEYREDYRRGDFLVRNLLGADPDTGALAVAALPRSGQTMQFQLRDAAAADEDLRVMLAQLRSDLGQSTIYGGCLCICAGRGAALFGRADHDASLVREIIGPVDVAGFFCNGEFGPVGSRSFVHGYTASFIVFAGPARTAEDEL